MTKQLQIYIPEKREKSNWILYVENKDLNLQVDKKQRLEVFYRLFYKNIAIIFRDENI